MQSRYVSLFVYLIGALVLLVLYPSLMTNHDAFYFLRQANHFLAGDIWRAISGHWDPLYMSLIAVCKGFGCSDLLALRLPLILGGLLCVVGIQRLSERLDIQHGWMLVIASIPIVWLLILIMNAEIFLAAGLIWLLEAALRERDLKRDLLLGILGAALYYAKGYGLPVAVVSVVAFAGVDVLMKETSLKSGFRSLMISLLVLLMCIAPLVLARSIKFGELTITRSGSYNAVYTSYEMKHSGFDTLIDPNTAHTDFYVYQEPLDFLGVPDQEPRTAYQKLALNYERLTWNGHLRDAVFVSLLSFFLGLFLLSKRQKIILLKTAAVSAVFCGGYLILLPYPRYFLPVFVLLIVLQAFVALALWQHGKRLSKLLALLVGLAMLSTLRHPVKDIRTITSVHSKQELRFAAARASCEYIQSKTLAAIAPNTDANDIYLAAAYTCDADLHGVLEPSLALRYAKENRLDVDCLLVVEDTIKDKQTLQELVNRYKLLFRYEEAGFSVYSLARE